MARVIHRLRSWNGDDRRSLRPWGAVQNLSFVLLVGSRARSSFATGDRQFFGFQSILTTTWQKNVHKLKSRLRFSEELRSKCDTVHRQRSCRVLDNSP